jgi:hypothetical protein
LQGREAAAQAVAETTEQDFISREFGAVSIEKIGLDSVVSSILKQRVEEIRKCLTARAPLAVIFLCGSTLEGILLGIACSRPKEFNQSHVSPKDLSGKVKQFQDWTLSDFINVARELSLVGEDVKKFSHALRDFRNYIHPSSRCPLISILTSTRRKSAGRFCRLLSRSYRSRPAARVCF